jgi:hypothetical protein
VTIEKGKSWGVPGGLPDGGVVVGSDAEAGALVTEARRAARPLPALGLRGGDLCRTLGGPSDLSMTFPCDLGAVLVDGRLHWFVSHLVTHDRLWRRAFVAMNGQWWNGLNLGPRAHPNDGVLDTFDAHLALGDIGKIRARARTGSHLPHPGIRERRAPAVQLELERPLPVWLDGRSVGRARTLSLRVEADALTVVV